MAPSGADGFAFEVAETSRMVACRAAWIWWRTSRLLPQPPTYGQVRRLHAPQGSLLPKCGSSGVELARIVDAAMLTIRDR